jgi:BED zinc finger
MPNPSGLRIPSPSRSRAVSPAPSGSAALSDLVWSYFRDAQDGEDSFLTGSDGRKHRLHYCLKCDINDKSSDAATWSTAWTSNAKGHLMRKHKIDIEASKCTQ